MLQRVFATDDSKTLLFQRLVLGIMMFPHGAQKLLGIWGGHGWDATMGMLTDGAGLPGPIAALVIIIEFFGALGVILGLGTRIAAFGIVAVMVGAIITVHGEHGFFAPMGIELHLLVLGLAIPLVVRGGGAYAVDPLIARAIGQRTPSGAAA
jgi:putative oxidoreductase